MGTSRRYNRRQMQPEDGPAHADVEAPTVIDVFCGAAGLSAGLEAAGWQTVAAIDHDADCIATVTANQARRLPIPGHPGRRYLDAARIIHADVTEVHGRDLRPTRRWRPVLLAGGAPCQPFSSAGRMLGLRDPRGKLILEFVRLADELRPRFILFENVVGLVTAKSPSGKPGAVLALVQRSFEEIGYACRFALLNAADYGAPQRRIRLFMIGTAQESLPLFPPPSHARDCGGILEPLPRWVTLADVLATRPAPHPDDVVRPSAARAPLLSRLVPGTGLRATGIVERNRPGGHWGYRQDCFLADPALPARTVRAASTPDWVFDADGGLRRLTWRECASLQGFPSDWDFVGPIASRFRQIGNAVQGHVARAVGHVLLDAATAESTGKPTSAPWPATFHRRVRYTIMETKVNGHHREAARQARVTAAE